MRCAKGRGCYPDVFVVCGEREFYKQTRTVVTNPTLIIEVLLPSTEKIDRGLKLPDYMKTPSIQEIVFVSQVHASVEVWRRSGDDWKYSVVVGLDAVLMFESIDHSLPLRDCCCNHSPMRIHSDCDEESTAMNAPGIVVKPALYDDRASIGGLLADAFDGHDETKLVEQLRTDGDIAIETVAVLNTRIVGYLCLHAVRLDGSVSESVRLLSLAPMAVSPEHQREGIGTELVVDALTRARNWGATGVVVLGHPGFYGRLGFQSELAADLANPFGDGDAWMAVELTPGSLRGTKGVIRYPAAFDALQ